MKKLVQAAILIMGICSGSSIQSSQLFAPQNSSSPFTLIKLDHRTLCPECNQINLIIPCYECAQKYRLPKPNAQTIPDHQVQAITEVVKKRLHKQLEMMTEEQRKQIIETEINKEAAKASSYFKPGIVVAAVDQDYKKPFAEIDALIDTPASNFVFNVLVNGVYDQSKSDAKRQAIDKAINDLIQQNTIINEACLNGDAERCIENNEFQYQHRERIAYIYLMNKKLAKKKKLDVIEADSKAIVEIDCLSISEDAAADKEERERKQEIAQSIRELIDQEEIIREKVKKEIRRTLQRANPRKRINEHDILTALQQAALLQSQNLAKSIVITRRALNKWRRMPGVGERMIDLAVKAHDDKEKRQQEQDETARVQARLERQNSCRRRYKTPTKSSTLHVPVLVREKGFRRLETNDQAETEAGKGSTALTPAPSLALNFDANLRAASGEFTARDVGSQSHTSNGSTASGIRMLQSSTPTARSDSHGSTRSIKSLDSTGFDSARSNVTDGLKRSTGSIVAMQAIKESGSAESHETMLVSKINLIVGSQTMATREHASIASNALQNQKGTKTPANGGKASRVVPEVSADANGESGPTASKYRALPGVRTNDQSSEQATIGCCAGDGCIIA